MSLNFYPFVYVNYQFDIEKSSGALIDHHWVNYHWLACNTRFNYNFDLHPFVLYRKGEQKIHKMNRGNNLLNQYVLMRKAVVGGAVSALSP